MDTARSIFGELDTGLMCLQRATDVIEQGYASQEKRMRLGDIKRARKYCINSAKYITRIKQTLAKFEAIAEKSNEESIPSGQSTS